MGPRQQHAMSEEERARILEFAHVFIRDQNSNIVFWNRGAENLYGYTREEAIGKRSYDLLKTVFPEPLEDIERKVRASGSWQGELRHTRRDGTNIIVASHWTAHMGEGGPAILEVDNDITALRSAEAALRDSELRYRTLAEAVPGIVFTADARGACDYYNSRWYKLTGLTPQQTLGSGWMNMIHPEDLQAVRSRWEAAVATGTAFESEWRLRLASGSYRRFLARGVPVRDEGGRIVKWLGIGMDVEDLKRADELLRNAQKAESIAFLAGGIAHQFNNLLTGILGGASFAAELIEPEHVAFGLLKTIVSAAERAAELTSQLLAYSGKGQFYLESVNLKAVVDDLLPVIEGSVPAHVRIVTHISPDTPEVLADTRQLRQLMIGLIMNAAEAIGDAPGELEIRTGTDRIGAVASRNLTDSLKPGTYACFEVRDTGCGIDPSIQTRIFDPFFTTKFAGRGLGLAAALGIVRGHQGAIQVSSRPGEGSTFRVLLPVAAPTPETRPPAPAEGPCKVLIVDDEEVVQDAARQILKRAGFPAVVAANGEEAVRIFRDRKNEIALIILDLAMPVMDGPEALRRIKQIDPGVPVLVASGYGEADTAAHLEGQNVTGFLQKPFTSRRLADAVRKALGDNGDGSS